jgi:Type I phosphodiesterase / nucleotide pyrophosphatase
LNPPGRKKAVVIVVDGLTPGLLENALDDPRAPALTLLAEHGRYRRAVSTFPSLTPVCLTSIATGAHGDVHAIPHLVWWKRDEERLVEYGSSFGAMRAAGAWRTLRDAVFNMNEEHLAADAVTLYEALEDAGYVTAAVNITCYRGRTPHLATVPGFFRPAYGPKRFFYFSLFESDRTGAPIAVLNRGAGSVDNYAATVGRWLVTRDGFDCLVLYLPDLDYASHLRGPAGVEEALLRVDAAIATLIAAAGGPDEFLERYAVMLLSDHGQTLVERPARLQTPFADVDAVLVTASNRAGMVYRLPACELSVRDLAEKLDGADGVETAMFLEDGAAVVRREHEELRFSPDGVGWHFEGDTALADYPNAFERIWAALHNRNAGEVLVSPSAGVEFVDLAGGHHTGGGSHGSLAAGDSEVPLLNVGLPGDPGSITEVAHSVLRHFGVEPPPYVRPLARAA